MIISFEEKDREKIESKGITIIEFKQKMYKIEKLKVALLALVDRILKTWKAVSETFLEILDRVAMAVEVVKDIYHYETSHRYKIAKVFSKCTGTDMYYAWRFTCRIKRWFARSCC